NQFIDIKVQRSGGKIIAAAVVGGTISEIGGGKFANGAVTGAYQMMFNEMMHQPKEKAVGRGGETWGKMYINSNVSGDMNSMDGHAWIRLESANGKTTKTMSLWGNRGEQEFWTDLEINAGYGEVSKSRYINVLQYN